MADDEIDSPALIVSLLIWIGEVMVMVVLLRSTIQTFNDVYMVIGYLIGGIVLCVALSMLKQDEL